MDKHEEVHEVGDKIADPRDGGSITAVDMPESVSPSLPDGEFFEPHESTYQAFKSRLMRELVVSCENGDGPLRFGKSSLKYENRALLILINREKP